MPRDIAYKVRDIQGCAKVELQLFPLGLQQHGIWMQNNFGSELNLLFTKKFSPCCKNHSH
jgi:hypothetical protein